MREQNFSVDRYVRVVKMRQTNHSGDYFPIIVNKGEFSIVPKG